MGIGFHNLRHGLRRLLRRGLQKTDRPGPDAPSTISTDPDTVAKAARVIVPYIADAYGKSSRSTAAGLAKALEILRTLENAGQNK